MAISSLYSAAIGSWQRRNSYAVTGIRAALIDMDGTLYDSMPLHSRAWERLAREEGLTVAPGEFFMHEGRTGAATINLLMRRERNRDATPDEIHDLYQRKTEYFRELPQPSAMPGAAQMLDVLRHEGITRVLVTGSGQSSLIDRLDIDFPGAFLSGMRVTSRDVNQGKPHPEPFLKGMKIADAQPWHTIVIENAPLGVEAGHRSGAFTIAVNSGPIPVGALEEAGADIVFPSMTALAEALPSIIDALRLHSARL